jgi:DNA-cytosine methyltransferase
MNVLSLFDGMSCGQQALERAGIKVDNYFASEIDKYAIQIAEKNYPNTKHLGDVTQVSKFWREHKFPKVDLLIGGSPCQSFSYAGNGLAFDDPRGKLFFEYIKIKELLKPKYFLLENVKMKQEYVDIISKYLGVEPIQINSSLVSAQNRKRLYWTNIPNVTQPVDKGIQLKDVLECGCVDREKSYCLDANYFKGGSLKMYFEKSRRQLVFDCLQVGEADIKGHDIIKRVYSKEGKAPSLTTMQGGHREPKVYCSAGAITGRRIDKNNIRKDEQLELPVVQCLEVNGKQKSRSLSTITKDTVVSPLPKGRYPDAYGEHQHSWRKLTPLECERLQTVKDNYTEGVSNSQRYKMLGNGWTIDVIAHILKNIKHTK